MEEFSDFHAYCDIQQKEWGPHRFYNVINQQRNISNKNVRKFHQKLDQSSKTDPVKQIS